MTLGSERLLQFGRLIWPALLAFLVLRCRLASLLFGGSGGGSSPRLLGSPPFRPLPFLQLLNMPFGHARSKAGQEQNPGTLNPPHLVPQPAPVLEPPLRNQPRRCSRRVHVRAALIDTPFSLSLLALRLRVPLLLLVLVLAIRIRKRNHPFQLLPNRMEGVVDHSVEDARVDCKHNDGRQHQ